MVLSLKCLRWIVEIPPGPEDFLLGVSLMAFFTSSSETSVSSFFSFFMFLRTSLLCLVVLGAMLVYCLQKYSDFCWSVIATLLFLNSMDWFYKSCLMCVVLML